MSSYIISTESMNIIVTAIFKQRDIYSNSIAHELWAGATRWEVGQTLYNLNQKAYNHRYNKEHDPDIYRHNDSHTGLMVAYDEIRKLAYQCCEGDTMDSDHGKLLAETVKLIGLALADNELEKWRNDAYSSRRIAG
jgi:hypothetical protein